MKRFQVFLLCVTNTGVTFNAPVVVTGEHQQHAAERAVQHVSEHGCAFQPMAGCPPVPVKVEFCMPVRVEDYSALELATSIPMHRTQQ